MKELFKRIGREMLESAAFANPFYPMVIPYVEDDDAEVTSR